MAVVDRVWELACPARVRAQSCVALPLNWVCVTGTRRSVCRFCSSQTLHGEDLHPAHVPRGPPGPWAALGASRGSVVGMLR